MAKILLNVNDNKEFVDGDMLIYSSRSKTFVAVKKEHIFSDVPKLYNKIECLEGRIKKLQAEVDYDHGKISEEEFKELCGLNK